ncbi:dipeptide/oligopeptide/nickel ABC transporter permease/ATP-binding protein [Humibacter antri]
MSSSTPSLARRVFRSPTGAVSAAILIVVAFVAIFGRLLAPHDPNAASLNTIFAPPSSQFLLGGDSAGRDIFSRLLAATQTSIAAALLGVVIALVVGVVTGLIAGYYGRWFDGVASWVTSLVMALPGIIVLLAARAVLGPSVWSSMAILGLLIAPAYFRLVYASVRAVRDELYVDAARVSGLGDTRIIGRHILSVVKAPVIIQTAMIVGIAIGIQSGLEFLGLGDITTVTWGSMLNEGFTNMYRAPMMILWPALAIGITSLSLILLANVIRDETAGNAGGTTRRPRRSKGRPRSMKPVGGASTAGVGEAATETAAVGASVSTTTMVAPVLAHTSSANGPAPLLRVAGLRIGYDQADGSVIEVVHGVDLAVRPGEVHGLIGESGSGKTQTAFAVLGLLPKGGRVLGGSLQFEEADLRALNDRQLDAVRGTRIAYIPQEPQPNLDPSFTIGSQLMEPLRVTVGLSRAAAKERALGLLERVGIPDPKRTFQSYPHEISGGMAQRVLIAGAISTDPQLVIADEPTTALDVTVQAEVLDLLRELQAERGMAMLLVTHNFGVVADLCDRVSVMQSGVIVESGSVRRILGAPEHPYTQSLLSAILDGGPSRGELVASGLEEVR